MTIFGTRPLAATSWMVTIPHWRPPSLNQLLAMHWGTRRVKKRKDAELIAAYCYLAEVPRARSKRRVSLVITLQGHDKRLDSDNAWKVVLDSLVHAKMLVDDNPDWVEQGPVSYERGKRATTIILEDL